MVLEHSDPPEVVERLANISVDAALATALQECKQELDMILADQARFPVTYNHYFTTMLQKQRQRKHEKHAERATQASRIERHHNTALHVYYDPALMKKAMADFIEPSMDTFTSEEALDKQKAYYKDELKYFINVVAKQIIERHLVEPLPDRIVSPLIIHQLTNDEWALGFERWRWCWKRDRKLAQSKNRRLASQEQDHQLRLGISYGTTASRNLVTHSACLLYRPYSKERERCQRWKQLVYKLLHFNLQGLLRKHGWSLMDNQNNAYSSIECSSTHIFGCVDQHASGTRILRSGSLLIILHHQGKGKKGNRATEEQEVKYAGPYKDDD
ncbi:hypothetical protein BU23DRAFT_565258 [Bimuria novae-zelandiae CBS 107.79]|uniref:Uncharacterized protein n=1 Tax=Bimuria novae-zelandiae CBS 107.79 TaxID=1447943 RepID=A0A6A5VN14_9PLEO|nr:hypothetical protein BU23DRAFT_565258 [Bimuria novae-zelandiae CBS 107.79]